MTLTQAQFETLVTNLERYAQQKPVSYTIRVGLLAALGYVYIFFVLGVILRVLISIIHFILYTNVINTVTLKLAVAMIIPLFVIARVILRSLWVSFPKPQGLKIHRQDAPKLFDMVDELTTKLKAPRFHHILLTEEFNAAVVQIPRLGLLGWQQNYLLLGLPLMQGLSSAQFSSVLAHELGHLSGNHSRFAGWIYRIQKTYSQIFQRLQENENQIGYWIMEFFFKWYTPFFSAYSFVLRRMNEYEADQCAMQLLGAKNTAEALINFQIKSKLLNNFFWQNIYKQAHESTEPPTNVYTEMSKVLLTSSKQEDSGRFLQECLAERTDFHDTHPSLRDRLKALGYLQKNSQELKIPSQFSVSAGREYLGNALPKNSVCPVKPLPAGCAVCLSRGAVTIACNLPAAKSAVAACNAL
jgi:Zn-dependent protease with chaperone function